MDLQVELVCPEGVQMYPRSPGTHIVGPWVTDNLKIYRDLSTGTQYIGNWASRGSHPVRVEGLGLWSVAKFRVHSGWSRV